MKTLKSILVAGLALASSLAAHADISAQAWLETYYLNPRPDALPANVRALSREGYFEKPGQVAVGIGFLATVFAQNPARVERWLNDLSGLPARHQRLVAAALWQSGNPIGANLLRALSADSTVRADVLRLANTPAQLISDTSVRSPSSMNLQWGAFLASGEERHITRIFDAIGMGEPGLDSAARAALATNAATHPRVLEICRIQLDRQPSEVQSVLRAALSDAEGAAKKPRS
jgi:hypothetical protein